MDEALAMLGALQAGLLALLSYQTRQLGELTAKIGELCGLLDKKE